MHLELNLLPLLLLTNAVAPLVRHRALSANICLCAVCQCILRVPTRRLLPPSLSSLPICAHVYLVHSYIRLVLCYALYVCVLPLTLSFSLIASVYSFAGAVSPNTIALVLAAASHQQFLIRITHISTFREMKKRNKTNNNNNNHFEFVALLRYEK